MSIIVVARAILKDSEGNILFGRRTNTQYEFGKLCLPGGKVENEGALSACVRKIKEETGLIMLHPRVLFADFEHTKDTDWVTVYFHSDYLGKPRVTKEFSEFIWIFPFNMPNDIAFRHDIAVRRYLNEYEVLVK